MRRKLTEKQKEKLYNTHIGLLTKIALKHIHKCRNLTIDDLIQEGFFQLSETGEKYDLGRKMRFSTFAYPKINFCVLAAIHDKEKTIRIPNSILYSLKKYKRFLKKWNKTKSPTMKEVASALNVSIDYAKKVVRLEKHGLKIVSFNRLKNQDRSRLFEYRYLPEDPLVIEEALKLIETCLTEKERTVIRLKFGLNGNKPHSLQQIKDLLKLKMSREGIRKMQNRAIRKLEKALEA